MKPIIVANWKCNPVALTEAKQLFNLVKKGVKDVKNIEVVICSPFVYLPVLKANGAQDCFWEGKGAFTGEVSPKMLKDLGCKYVIIGHSERRRYFEETDEMINKKTKAALKVGLRPILCIEKISQIPSFLRKRGGRRGRRPLRPKKDLGGVIIAYEPVFAIGTGKPCSIEKAKKMRLLILKNLNKNLPVLYGGSVNSQNARDYVKKAGFQGLLVGGASLNAQEFIKIVKNVAKT